MDFEAIRKAAEGYKPAMVKFLRDMIAIPSESCEEGGRCEAHCRGAEVPGL